MNEILLLTILSLAYGGIQPSVEVEEVVCEYESPNNGAGPLWCYGAPLLVRSGDKVFLSTMETGEDVQPLCNTRWQLWRRDAKGWKIIRQEEKYKEREPCPIIGFNGKLFLSVNPSLKPPGTRYGACEPHLLEFSVKDLSKHANKIIPDWAEGATFTDHSYRGVAIDRLSGEILLLNIDAKGGDQFWSFRDKAGNWSRYGRIHFPIRACYPQVSLKEQTGHVLAIGDIVEPNEEWRNYKHEQTGRDWDYVFRRLFYTWTPDITETDFASPIEIDNVDPTGGYIRNQDMWVDDEGVAHILYLKQPVVSILRDKFFPDIPLVTSLEYCAVKEGNIANRLTLIKGGEGISGEIPRYGRFHVTDKGRLLLVYRAGDENKLMQVLPEKGKSVSIPLDEPFSTFFTNTERGGSAPSKTIDLFGIGRESHVLRYARVVEHGVENTDRKN